MDRNFRPNRRHAIALTAGASVSAMLNSRAHAKTNWVMATPYADINPHTRNVRLFVEDVQKNEELRIDVHSNATLVRHPDIPVQLRAGTIQAGEVLVSSMSNQNALFGFDSIPGLTPSYADARRLWLAVKPHLFALLEKQGIVGLYTMPWQPSGIFTNRRLTSLNDLKGSKFRTFSPATIRFAELFGAQPTTVQVPDLPVAFQTGMVDAMITSGATGIDTQAWDYLKYYYDTQSLIVMNIIMVNKRAMDALPAATRQHVLAAAARAEERGWKTAEEITDTLNKTMQQKGIEIVASTPQLRADITKIGEQMANEWVQKTGPVGAAILAEYRK